VFDRAVFPGRVHRLKDEQQGPAVLGVEHLLLFREPRNAALEELRCVALVQIQATGVAGIEVLQPEALALGDAERLNVVLYALEDLLSGHAAASLWWRRNLRSSGQTLIFRAVSAARPASGQDDVRCEGEQFCRVFTSVVGIACGPAGVDPRLAAVDPAQLLEPLQVRREARLPFRIIRAPWS
jgi:hypothetical protein